MNRKRITIVDIPEINYGYKQFTQNMSVEKNKLKIM